MQRVLTLAQFPEVPSLELWPFTRLMVEPPSQFSRGSGFLGPEVDLRGLLRQASRPQPFDQNAAAV